MKKNRSLLLLASTVALMLAPLLTACSDDDDVITPVDPVVQTHTYNYHLWVYGEQGSQQMVLDSIASSVAKVEGVPSWLTTTTETVGNHPALILTYSGITGP